MPPTIRRALARRSNGSWPPRPTALRRISPDATHDQNSPARQHFYLGAKDRRTEITLTPQGANRLRLVVSGS